MKQSKHNLKALLSFVVAASMIFVLCSCGITNPLTEYVDKMNQIMDAFSSENETNYNNSEIYTSDDYNWNHTEPYDYDWNHTEPYDYDWDYTEPYDYDWNHTEPYDYDWDYTEPYDYDWNYTTPYDDDDWDYTTSNSVSKTGGRVENGYYINDWANIKFSEKEFANYVLDQKAAYGHGDGFFSSDEIIIIGVYDIAFNADDFLENYEETAGYEFGDIEDVTIAKANYRYILALTDRTAFFVSARNIGNKLCTIMIMSDDVSDIESILSNITPAK